MKIYKFMIGCAVSVALSACNSWLDITPQDSLTEEELYETGEGYRVALNGVYQQMASSEMYGCQMSWGLVDAMGQMYLSGRTGIPSSHAYYKVVKGYSYKDQKAQTLIENLWSKTYNSIANCNNLLERIKNEDPSKFAGNEMERQLIQGEALALRAYLHFDMLRLFAPAPVKDDGRAYIPYFETYPSRFEAYQSVQEVLGKARRDLEEAKNLVAPFDTLPDHQIWMETYYRYEAAKWSSTDHTTDDLFYAYRGYRMNYYAICAVLARVYNYSGMHKEANDLAQTVIDATYDGSNYFVFTSGEGIEDGNCKLYDDLIFALSNPKMYDIYESGSMSAEKHILFLNGFSSMFDDEADYRKKYLVTKTGANGECNKYLKTNTGNLTSYARDMIPMIRLSEMYYIQAECAMEKGDAAMAESKLDEVRKGRNCTIGKLHIKDKNAEDAKKAFNTELLKEGRREFMAEGQLFFYYKKLGIRPTSMTADEQFYFPKPDNEVIN